MDTSSDSATLAYIRYVLQELNISPTALAHKAGISPTTLTRPLNNKNHKFNLSATTIEKIANASGINHWPFFAYSDFASTSLATIHDPGTYNENMWDLSGGPIDGIVLIGAAGLGLWQETGKNRDLRGILYLRHVEYDLDECFSVLLQDGHAGNVGSAGDELICVRFAAYRRKISSGQHVLLERRRDGGRLIELTIRRLQEFNAGWQLNTPCHEKPYQDQVVIGELPGGDDAQVIGVVEYVVRPLR